EPLLARLRRPRREVEEAGHRRDPTVRHFAAGRRRRRRIPAGVRRIAFAAVAAALAAVPVSDAAARRPHQARRHVADGKLGDWRGRPTMIAGRTTTSRGEYIYTDLVYDHYGPDL